ncbi:MAG: hypothetical protein QOH95_1694 [Gaiellaceae bacterium]|nr:hypothetical protein [Gaiellaceae bacterium]
MRGSLLFLLGAIAGLAALLATAAAPAGHSARKPRPCPAVCIHVGSTLNPITASAAVGAPVGFLAVDGARHRLSGAFFSVSAIRAKDPPVVRLSAGSYGYSDSTGAGSGKVFVLPAVSRSGRKLHATWAKAGTPGTSWHVWVRVGQKKSTWLARTSKRSGTLTLPSRLAQVCVSAATVAHTTASAASPPACVGASDGGGSTQGLTYRELVLADRPVAFWPFSGDTADAAGSHPLTLAGGASVGATGIEGGTDQALLLNGNRQFASSPFGADLNPRVFTLEAWARVDGGAGTARKVLVARDRKANVGLRGFILEATAANTWKIWLGHGTKSWDSITGPALAPGRWTHLVVTFDGSAATFYVNGSKAGSVFTPFEPNNQSNLRLGVGQSSTGAPDFFFDGALDDVAIYRSALPPDRVTAHFQAAHP